MFAITAGGLAVHLGSGLDGGGEPLKGETARVVARFVAQEKE